MGWFTLTDEERRARDIGRKAPPVGWFDCLADPEVYEEGGRLKTSRDRDVTDEITHWYGRKTTDAAIAEGKRQRQRRGFRLW